MSPSGQPPEELAYLAHRQGMKTVGRVPIAVARMAVRRSMPTMHHALRVFDAAVEVMGKNAWVEQVDGLRWRRVYRLDNGFIIPTPVMELVKGRSGITGPVLMLGGNQAPSESPKADDYISRVVPRGRDMHEGKLELREGPSRFELVYGEEGRFKETCTSAGDWYTETFKADTEPFRVDTLARPPTTPPVSVLCHQDLSSKGHSVDQFADILSSLDPGRCVPARVWMPEPLPCGVSGITGVGIAALRRVLWRQAPPEGAGFVIIDGLEGTIVEWGDDPHELLRRFKARVAECQPLPEAMKNRDGSPVSLESRRAAKGKSSSMQQEPRLIKNEDGAVVGISTGTIRVGGGHSSAAPAWPELTPDNTPALMLELPPRWTPNMAADLQHAGFQRSVQMVGQYGSIFGGAVRDEPDGWTLLGEGIVDIVDLGNLDEQINAALEDQRRVMDEFASLQPSFQPPEGHQVSVLQCWDFGYQRPMPPRLRSQAWRSQLEPAHLDGDEAAWSVTCFRRTG